MTKRPDLHLFGLAKCPKLIPLRCTHGIDGNGTDKCKRCGVANLGIIECLKKTEMADEIVEVMVWRKSIRQGMSNGVQNTQKELHPEEMTIQKLVDLFMAKVIECIPHYQEICWMNIMMELDLDYLPVDTLLIFTDFAAMMALRAFQTKNSSVDGHCVNDNFVCMYNKRQVVTKNKMKKNEVEAGVGEKSIRIFTVDVHHFFAETISKGKKADHVMHNIALDAIINHYKAVFETEMGTTLKFVRTWTDNAPGQYRCRQNFIKVASICECHFGIHFTHRLAVVENFKGVHDGYGKGPSHLVRSLELQGIRSANAKAVFANCTERLQRSKADTKWQQHEMNNDYRLRIKGTYGMDSRIVWFVTETIEDYNVLILLYPNHILLINRKFIPDTKGHKAINDTTKLHEICSVAENVPEIHPRVWPVLVANLPCNCKHCRVDRYSQVCIYKAWRHSRFDKMQIECIGPEEANSWVDRNVVHVKNGNNEVGRIEQFFQEAKEWNVTFVSGNVHSTERFSYATLCKLQHLSPVIAHATPLGVDGHLAPPPGVVDVAPAVMYAGGEATL